MQVHYNSKTVIGESLALGNKASNLKQHSGIDTQNKRDAGSFFGPNLNGSSNPQSALSSSGGHGTEQRQQHVTFFDPPVNTALPTPNNKKPGVKKASLFAWMTLQSIPEVSARAECCPATKECTYFWYKFNLLNYIIFNMNIFS